MVQIANFLKSNPDAKTALAGKIFEFCERYPTMLQFDDAGRIVSVPANAPGSDQAEEGNRGNLISKHLISPGKPDLSSFDVLFSCNDPWAGGRSAKDTIAASSSSSRPSQMEDLRTTAREPLQAPAGNWEVGSIASLPSLFADSLLDSRAHSTTAPETACELDFRDRHVGSVAVADSESLMPLDANEVAKLLYQFVEAKGGSASKPQINKFLKKNPDAKTELVGKIPEFCERYPLMLQFDGVGETVSTVPRCDAALIQAGESDQESNLISKPFVPPDEPDPFSFNDPWAVGLSAKGTIAASSSASNRPAQTEEVRSPAKEPPQVPAQKYEDGSISSLSSLQADVAHESLAYPKIVQETACELDFQNRHGGSVTMTSHSSSQVLEGEAFDNFSLHGSQPRGISSYAEAIRKNLRSLEAAEIASRADLEARHLELARREAEISKKEAALEKRETALVGKEQALIDSIKATGARAEAMLSKLSDQFLAQIRNEVEELVASI
eukprot:TRINITY_DN16894_c0_g1_i1.p1 TRINITY_DN16894_c0_g1~~TRINITY_DN16894_c0_g1_i1.p1  ORF type:complete len:551 (+),score=83.98 TRINITY_DN16894_c0_g1_i1:162-1655(+)